MALVCSSALHGTLRANSVDASSRISGSLCLLQLAVHYTERPSEDAVEQTLQLPASPAPLQSMTRGKEATATAGKDLR